MGEAAGETQAQLDKDSTVRDTDTAYKKGGTQVWLVGEGGADCLAWDLVYGPLLQDTVGLS